MENLKRMWFELLVTILVTLLFLTRTYESAPSATQLLMLKINLISLGLLHAHVAGKLLFKTKLEWSIPWEMASMAHVIRGLLYVALPLYYSIGG